MVHPDYQYDPTLVPKIIEPILKGQADLVLGSRLKGGGSAIQQGMPWWKYVSNRFLTGVENLAFGLHLSEFHTGYRAFSREALEAVNFRMNSDGFVFDQEIISQAVAARLRIAEIAVPVRYFAEASSASLWASCRYGLRILLVVAGICFTGRGSSGRGGSWRCAAAITAWAPGVARRALIAVRGLPRCGKTRRVFSIRRGGRWASGGGVRDEG
jgi:hypothetical protein